MDWNALRDALGTEPEAFPSDVLIHAPEWFTSQVDLLLEAISCAYEGERVDNCQSLIRKIRSSDIQDWFIGIGQWSGTYRASVLKVQKPITSGGIDYPRQLRYPLLERDGFRCRYCNSKVICIEELKVAAKLLQMPELVSGSGNRGRHGIRMIVQATFDHVIPASRFNGAGRNDMANLVTSCWPCNFGKAYYKLHELQLSELHEPDVEADKVWNGLVHLRSRRRSHSPSPKLG
jgi:5-methylcytosine-specific restriction endonuclease McrA